MLLFATRGGRLIYTRERSGFFHQIHPLSNITDFVNAVLRGKKWPITIIYHLLGVLNINLISVQLESYNIVAKVNRLLLAHISALALVFKLIKSTPNSIRSTRKYRFSKLNTMSEWHILVPFNNDKVKLHLLHSNYTSINVFIVFWRGCLAPV